MTGSATTAGRLTAGEEALWLLQELVGDSGVANVALALVHREPPRWWPLREALRWLVQRHPALRCSVEVRDGVPYRLRHPVDGCPLDVDILACTPERLDAELTAYAAAPFRLDRPPLLRVGVFTVAPDEHHICLSAHHIAVDATSLATIVDELLRAYAHIAETEEPPLLPPVEPVPGPSEDDGSLRYWQDHVRGYDPVGMRLPDSRSPGPVPTLRGDVVRRQLTPAATAAMAMLRTRHRVTDAIVLLATYHAVLRRLGAGPDQVVGVMVDARGGRGTGAVGYHVSTLPMRVTVDDDAPFADLVDDVKRVMLDGLPHASVSFERIAADRSGDPADWRTRLVRQLFNVRQRGAAGSAAGRAAQVRDVSTGLSRFDLELTVHPHGGSVELVLLFATEVHDRPFAERLLGRFELVLAQAAADAGRTVAELDLRTVADHRIVDGANATATVWPEPSTVPGLIAAAAQAHPDAVAVVEPGRQVTYRTLCAVAAGVSAEIRANGGRPGDVVAVALPRGAAALAVVLGIWAAGAAYLPLDPEHPPARLAMQLGDAGCRLAYASADPDLGTGDPPLRLTPPDLAAESTGPGRLSDASPVPGWPPAPAAHPAPDRLAYLIYTSGSTGRPKGVRLTHANLRNVVGDFQRRLSIGPGDAMLWLTTFAFDISTLEVCLPLAAGARVVVAPDASRTRPTELLDLLEREDVTVVQATPTTWRLLAPAARGRLAGRTVLCGGEPLPASLLPDLRATGARVLNVYGPTETTIWSTAADLTAPDAPLTVGRPLANTVALVLDDDERPVPVGRSGHLWLAGAGVAEGYHRRPELTAASFRTDPRHGRRYRTGDLARWRPDATLELIGRRDRQVKLRAHRIELGEIEAAVEEHAEVRAAAVVLRDDPSGDGYLVAFVAASDRVGLAEDVWAHAARMLPAYCVPGRIVVLPRLPTGPSGKVDLPALAARAAGDPPTTVAPAPGRDAGGGSVRAVLVRLWREALGAEELTTDSNFFLHGGTSLRAVALAGSAAAALQREVTMGMIFRAPTPSSLAALIEGSTVDEDADAD